MGTSNSQDFDEKKSIQLIHEMLQVSKRKFQSDGILMVLWGWILSANYFTDYLLRTNDVHYELKWYIKIFFVIILISGIAFTLFYILKQRKKVQTYVGVSLRYVWLGMILSQVLVNLIIFNVMQEVNFELQHPIFMVIVAFATVVTGGILRYRLVIIGGLCFGLLALVSSYLPLSTQLLLEGIAWFIAFVVPGHILYSKRNN